MNENNLIFLISQPRAGSTMLQNILGSHPNITTKGEPWLLLHPLYGFNRQNAFTANFDWQLYKEASDIFFKSLPPGKNAYFEGVKRMYLFLYSQSLRKKRANYFLDKTPRYYLIIKEIFCTFPKANYIFLFRNPLAVLNSVVNIWSEPNLFKFKKDLLSAPKLLVEGKNYVGDRGISVQYEEIVKRPKNEIQKVCSFLDIDYLDALLDMDNEQTEWDFGDKYGIKAYDDINEKSLYKWLDNLENPFFWKLCNDYLKLLENDAVEQMGYSYDYLSECLESHHHSWMIKKMMFPLSLWLSDPIILGKRERRLLAKGFRVFKKYGLFKAIYMALERLWKDNDK